MNRNPRDLLLSRHARAEGRLDCLRCDALAGSLPLPVRRLLPALFYPQRRIWLALAATWLVILVTHLAQPAAPRVDPRILEHAAWLHAANQAQLHALFTTSAASR